METATIVSQNVEFESVDLNRIDTVWSTGKTTSRYVYREPAYVVPDPERGDAYNSRAVIGYFIAGALVIFPVFVLVAVSELLSNAWDHFLDYFDKE